MVARSVAELGRFLDGLEPVGPGLVPVAAWRPDGSSPPLPFLGAVARKP